MGRSERALIGNSIEAVLTKGLGKNLRGNVVGQMIIRRDWARKRFVDQLPICDREKPHPESAVSIGKGATLALHFAGEATVHELSLDGKCIWPGFTTRQIILISSREPEF